MMLRNLLKRNSNSYLRRLASGWSWRWRRRTFCSEPQRDSIQYDVVIVGAGPAGLSAAIRLKQVCRENDTDLSVCVVEKGAELGAHILSGNVFEPRALDELLPNWKQEESPITVPVSSDKFWFLTKNHAFPLPCPFNNRGNYVISLSQLVRWMGVKAEKLGVEIYPGFAASEILYDSNDTVVGIRTNDMGISKDGSKKENFQPGIELKGNSLSLSLMRTSQSKLLRFMRETNGKREHLIIPFAYGLIHCSQHNFPNLEGKPSVILEVNACPVTFLKTVFKNKNEK